MEGLSDGQLTTIEIAERVTSVFSVLGAILIISTFLWDSRFRKPINRLVFYASWGNLFANVATLISREGIKQGVEGPLCQFQAFLIQWFLPADALFTFAMACNVYLTFFKQHDAAALRKLELRYLALCYGLPLVPAVVFLCIDTAERGKIFGSANLWCWISLQWNGLRIAAFYGPIWIIILFDVFIYIKVGFVVFRWRKSLVSTSTRTNSPAPGKTLKERPTYEVNVVSQVPHTTHNRTHSMASQRPASVHVHPPPIISHSRHVSEQRLSDQSTQVNTTISYQPGTGKNLPRAVDANRATLQYCYTAILFSFALIVTWVPSTINRLYSLIRNEPSPYGLDITSATVLPLQGFWNTIIYIVTSWAACRSLWSEHLSSRCTGRTRRASPPHGGGHKLQPLGSTEFQQTKPSEPKDPYPLSPIWSPVSSRRWTFADQESTPPPRPSRNSGIFNSDVDEHNERADIVMRLDDRGRIVRQGRSQFDWGIGSESRSSVVNTAASSPATVDLPTSRSNSAAGTRGLGRSNSQMSYRSRDGFVVPPHHRQGSGHIVEQMKETRI